MSPWTRLVDGKESLHAVDVDVVVVVGLAVTSERGNQPQIM